MDVVRVMDTPVTCRNIERGGERWKAANRIDFLRMWRGKGQGTTAEAECKAHAASPLPHREKINRPDAHTHTHAVHGESHRWLHRKKASAVTLSGDGVLFDVVYCYLSIRSHFHCHFFILMILHSFLSIMHFTSGSFLLYSVV